MDLGWIDTDPGGGSINTHFESEVGITLQIRGGLTLILGGVDRHSTWKGSAMTLEGSPLPLLILGAGICPPPTFRAQHGLATSF